MGNLVWNDPVINSSASTAHEMDGRFGWNLFEGKKVEIDYDHNLIIIHSRLPDDLKGFVRSKIKFIHSYVCAEGIFVIEDKKYVGDFMFDTGSDQALILDSSWAGKQNLTRDLKLIRTSVLHDGGGVKHETRIVLSPRLEITGGDATDYRRHSFGLSYHRAHLPLLPGRCLFSHSSTIGGIVRPSRYRSHIYEGPVVRPRRSVHWPEPVC